MGCVTGRLSKLAKMGWKMGKILRDGIASGRGVHRKMGVLIQESRSKFGPKIEISRKIGISGVGVV